jgi:hypothetical protein
VCIRTHLRDISAIVIEISRIILTSYSISPPKNGHLLLQVDGKNIPRCSFCAAEIANSLSKMSLVSWGTCHIS